MGRASFLKQAWAFFVAEWQRQASNPAWAMLLIIWTLVCGLFFRMVVDHAAAHELPPGETPMSFFFRATPWLLPVLLMVFIPYLTMDIIAGRRESRRLEHLLISGARSPALILGSYAALMSMLAILLIPPVLFHGILSVHGQLDFGKTLAALIGLWVIMLSYSALALAISAWSPHRYAAGLLAVALGLLWWIADVFGEAFQAASFIHSLREALPLAPLLYDGAAGLLRDVWIVNHLLVAAAALYIAICGVDRRQAARQRFLNCLLLPVATLMLCFGFTAQLSSHRDWTFSGVHALSEQSSEKIRTAAQENNPVSLTFITTPTMRHNAEYGQIVDTMEHFLRSCEDAGADVHFFDPGRDPLTSRSLIERYQLTNEQLQAPLLLVRQAQQWRSLEFEHLALQNEQNILFNGENALLNALVHMSAQQSPTLYWWNDHSCLSVPKIDEAFNKDPEYTFSAWTQALQTQGREWQPLKNIEQADSDSVVIIAAPKEDCEADFRLKVHSALQRGVHFLFLFDGQDQREYLHWSILLRSFGINTAPGFLAQRDRSNSSDSSEMGLLPALEVIPTQEDSSGALALLLRDQRPLFIPFARALHSSIPEYPQYSCSEHLQSPADAVLFHQGRSLPVNQAALLLLCSANTEKKNNLMAFDKDAVTFGKIAALSSSRVFSDAYYATSANSVLGHILLNWLRHDYHQALLPPRSLESSRYLLSTMQQRLLSWGVGLGLPFIVLCAALFLGWRRRQR